MTSYPTESRSERIKRRLSYAAVIAGGALLACVAAITFGRAYAG
jgi:hypothetical protein